MKSRFERLVDRFAPHRAESRVYRSSMALLAAGEALLGRPGYRARSGDVQRSGERLDIDGHQVMQDWERPIMRTLAEAATESRGDVLEIGFGLGISASFLIAARPRSYTVVEANPVVLDAVRSWANEQPVPVTVIAERWQDAGNRLGTYDGILFDPYPTSFRERTDAWLLDTLLGLREHLRPGGVLAYFWRYYRAVPDRHQAALLRGFSEVSLRRVTGLAPPPDCEYWRDDAMICVACRR